MTTPNRPSTRAQYLPNQTIFSTDDSSLLKMQLENILTQIALRLNDRTIGLYETIEQLTGEKWTWDSNQRKRQTYRTVVETGTLPNAGSSNINHGISGIDSNFTFTKIYGAATDPTALTFIPLPYASTVLANNIQVDVSSTQVTITTGANRTNFTRSFVILEYMKEI